MKILCVSDQIDPLIYNQNAKQIFPDIDLILCAGDLPMDYIDFIVSVFNLPTYFVFGNHNLKEFHFYSKKNTDDYSNPVQSHSDTSHAHGGTYLGFKAVENENLKFIDPETGKQTHLLIAGAPGSLRYNNGLNQYTDRQMKFRLLMMIPRLIMNKIKYGRYLDIFLTHASPRHIHDKEDPCHKGFDCFNWFIQKYKPTYLVHGHIHLYDMREERIGKYYDTTVVNAYAHQIIELPVPENLSSTEEKLSDSTQNNTPMENT